MHKILIYGPSGMGKTSSLRNLDPKKTAIINTDKKAMPLEGWRNKYMTIKDQNNKVDWAKTNYVQPRSSVAVLSAMKMWEAQPHIETVVLDTLTHLVTAEYIETALEGGFKGYANMGKEIYRVLDFVRDSSKNYIVIGHSTTDYDGEGKKVTRIKSQGKMIEGMAPESFFTTVLFPEVIEGENGKQYMFRTQSNGADSAKSPAVFKEDGSHENLLELHIPNDVKFVLDELEKFEN